MLKYKKIFLDVTFNILATAIPLVVLQIFIYPFLAKSLGEDVYGFMLVIVSVINIIPGPLGNALNNIRLINEKVYNERKLEGDFNILFIGELFLNCFIVIIVFFNYGIRGNELFLLLLVSIFRLLIDYYIVAFRIELNFKKIFLNNIMQAMGFLLGAYLYYLRKNYWEIIYLCGYGCSIIYILHKSKLINEKISITPLFIKTSVSLLILILATILGNLLTYADRSLIYPILGGTAVSVYYTATIFGKIVSSAISPINGVLLSYISKRKKIEKNTFILSIYVSIGVAFVTYIFGVLISIPALKILYPQLAAEAIKYVPFTTLNTAINIIISILNPFILNICNIKWQALISGTVLVIYIITSILLCNIYALYGFCIGIIISSIVKLFIMLVVGLKSFK